MVKSPAGSLVSSSWLAAHLSEPGLRIIDCRHRFDDASYGERAYRAARLPGAVHFGLQSHLVGSEGDGRSPLPAADDFAMAASRAGIGDDDLIVCYDDGFGGVAARAWWLFRYFGHDRVFVLREGFPGWSGPVETGEPAIPPPASFTIRPGQASLVRASDVQAALSSGRTAVIDARGAPRFRGEAPPLDAIEGHIPGAINIPATGGLVENDRLRGVIAKAEHIIAYCGSGIVACNIILAGAEIGRDDIQLYAGSWSDWAARDLPARSGDETEPLQFHQGGT